MEKWFLHTKKADFNTIAGKYHITPMLARIMRNRDIEGDDAIQRYLHGTVQDMYDPMLLKDMDTALKILTEKIKEQKRIRIIGDYDIDGVCSTWILYKGLTRCNAVVDFEIPDRIKDGYGINQNIIRLAYEDGIDTLVTCDNGISALEQIAYAKELGLTVIVTDHHDVPMGENGELLVSADAIINPRQAACQYPLGGICGAIVAYKLIEALFRNMRIPREEALPYLEMGAIATVGDVMDLQDENRIIVKYGLSLIRKTTNPGLKALIKLNDLEPERISAYHIGFVIGPCLNAGGRLDTAKLALNLLLAEDDEEALLVAKELKGLNDTRKSMTQQGLQTALEIMEQEGMSDDKVLVVYLTNCHESLAGIIAGRVREKYEKPTFILTKTESGVKGSGRSIERYHMLEALNHCKDLLGKFGGHPMAAGLSLEEENIEAFRKSLNAHTDLKEEDFIKKIWIDVPMPLEYVNEPFIQELSLLEPFGKGNPKPLFAQKDLRIRRATILGKNANVVKMSLVTKDGLAMDGILFREGEQFMEELQGKYGEEIRTKILSGSPNDICFSVTYYPNINEYNGKKTLQIIIEHYTI